MRENCWIITRYLLVAAILLCCAVPLRAEDAQDRPIDFARDVKPILAGHCAQCHGALRQKGGLRLDAGSLALKGGDSGEIIELGSAEESLLIEYILPDGDDPPLMPPDGQGTPLKEEQVAVLTAWINQGAKIPADEEIPEDPRKHWAFQRIERPEVPMIDGKPFAGNPIDAFILAKHKAKQLTARPETDKATLLRRIYLDLIGLPPTRDELQAFLADPAPDAYEQVVDRLLSSPHYGERWGRHWMDVWRYSDWAGYRAEVRESQPHIWRWRDWIIESLNADKPYDRMVQEMLAGDEIAPGDPDTLRATGYLVRNWYKFNRNVWLESTVEHTPKAFLGITMNCAKCHDHMYDPILQKDYYQFRAIFEPHRVRTDQVPGQLNTKKDGLVRVFDQDLQASTFLFARGNEKHPDKDNPLTAAVPVSLLPEGLKIEPVALTPRQYYPGLRDHVQQGNLNYARAALRNSETALKKLTDQLVASTAETTDGAAQPATVQPPSDLAIAVAAKQVAYQLLHLQSVQARIAADEAKYATPPAASAPQLAAAAAAAERQENVAKAQWDVAKAEAALQAAKDAEKPEDDKTKQAVKKSQEALTKVQKDLETALAAQEKPEARYSPFGEIYPTQSSGRRLALARWITDRENPLAARVAVNHMWLRHFGEALVPSVFDFGLNGKSPSHPALLDWLAVELLDNGWTMKQLHRLMVTSQAYRMASTVGDATENLEADPDNVYLWRMNPRRMEAEAVRDAMLYVCGQLDTTAGGPEIDQTDGQTNLRRSIYFRSAKEKQMLFLELFDQANVNDCYRRNESIVPQQALAMVNSPLALAQGRVLAKTLTATVGEESTLEVTTQFLNAAFEQILCRRPTDEERATCSAFLQKQTELLATPGQLTQFESGPEVKTKPSENPTQRARENLVQVLLNHNDFFTIR
ncbi:Planctomycete cytochrome C [Symmachiella dynata]|uniref:PSD1 and planctomycete cytochrome C domain-containing protein n=1 Tax=Symmachiella dynata TaxID=2527995 RepID=UPI001188C8F3|nr:PSD1 and planctomycete cytochrome C domain-containing protein [Symmachiella dynata]QDT48801.1 Planctomycete cytochrome C [Symmachiella dynata]